QWADQLRPATDRKMQFDTTGGQVPLNVRRPACALTPDGAHRTDQLGDGRALDVALCHACRLAASPFTRQRRISEDLEYNLLTPTTIGHPTVVAAGRHTGATVHSCEPLDPESKGGVEATVKTAKADLVPTEANRRGGYVTFGPGRRV
ncbi:MAG TPA: hypothetical protein VGQ92_06425, partial [Actinoplanes sp.]|nr:hypothetical protein [Actinoplanes sp.]